MLHLKNLIVSFFISIVAVLSPIHAMLISCGVLISADLITGMIAAKRRKESIRSAEMRRSITKLFVYQITIICGFVLQTYMLENMIPVTKIVAGVIGMVEFKSILENASTIAGKNLLEMIMEKLGSKNAKGK